MKKSVSRILNKYSNWWDITESTMTERRYEKRRSHKTFRRIEKREVQNYEREVN